MAGRRVRKRQWRWGRILFVFLLFGILYLASLAARIYWAGLQDNRVKSDAIIVLGAAQYDGRPSPVYQARLDHALSLYHDGYAPYLLFTGGRQTGDRFTEAGVGRRYARRHGVPESAILLESHGRTTWQSLRAAAEILRQRHLQTAILVSDPFHAYRLERMARDLGMTVVVSPASHSRVRSRQMRAHYIMREVAVYAVYRLFGI